MWHLKSGNNLLEKKILAERVKATYQQAIMTSINSWATAALFMFIPNEHSAPSVLWGWFLAITLTCLGRIILTLSFKKANIDISNYSKWGLAYAGAVMTTALVWCSALFILSSPDNLNYQLFLMMILVALCIGASHASTTYPIVGQVYNIPVMSSFIISCILVGDASFYVMAALGMTFAIMMLVVGRDSDKRFEEIQQLRFELAQKKDDAEKANMAKSRFLAAASHDLRQPLHALTLFTGLLKEKNAKNNTEQIVDNIDASVDALQDLFNSLLDISKLDAGTLNIERVNFSLNQVLAPIENEFKAEANIKQLDFYVESNVQWVESDPNLLSRIIRNLVSNAIRYTDSGSVVVLCKKQQSNISIEVRDTGHGIKKEHHKDIFNEFVQLRNSERDRKKGLGLGLAIVKRLAELLNHPLNLESKVDEGTSFFIHVPLAKNQQATPFTPHPTFSALSLTGLNIMLIDDEQSIREGTTTLLATWGCNAHAFATEKEALTFIRMHHFIPDILLVDYRLQHKQTGIEAIESIESFTNKKISAAIITGDTGPDRLKEAEQSGYLLLHKPVKPMQLRKMLMQFKTKQTL